MRTLRPIGLQAWLKTSGGKGLHVGCRHDYDTVKGFSQSRGAAMARAIPAKFVAKSGPTGWQAVCRLFAQWPWRTTASAFSARSRPGLGVSQSSRADYWTIATAREHLGNL
ncbi:non-homologous end-joining DNA ligase LigD [Variovorax davisae]|uniref:non-homologous end-joining DNA ligase LigD n=1 Tax=Variovorax davisae TaxID=3053515 RepID=UPI0033654073